ncbi:DUF1127 domain-containing protein [Paracoccus aminophilus]|nr:DUF1127 domain-containing protein [Paracoccus aminophilus]
MAVLDLNHGTVRGTTATAGGASGFFGALAGYFARRSLYRQTVNELNQLSDRELADLGINRLDITSIAASAVKGQR